MKKLLLSVLLAVSTQAGAQLKNINEFADWGAISYKQLEGILNKGYYWKQVEKGKMDTLTYVRWVPENLGEKNMGDCVMAFFKSKDDHLDHIVYQWVSLGNCPGPISKRNTFQCRPGICSSCFNNGSST